MNASFLTSTLVALRPIGVFVVGCILIAGAWSCKKNANTPEAVARQWQAYIDSNQFAEAKKLSTPSTISVLETMQAFMATDPDTRTVPTTTTTFNSMVCKEEGNKSVCIYVLHEDGGEVTDSFVLQKVNGQWLVHLAQDTSADPADQELFEDLEETLLQEDSLYTKSDTAYIEL